MRGLQREYLRGSGKGRACVVTPRSCVIASGRYRARSAEAQSGKAGKVHLWTGDSHWRPFQSGFRGLGEQKLDRGSW